MIKEDKNFYDKRIIYLDYFERGQKVKNGGFFKWEAKGESSRVQIHIRGLYPTDTLLGEIQIVSAGESYPADRVMLNFGTGSYTAVWKNDGLAGTDISYEECDGILIRLSENRMLKGVWRERPKQAAKTPPAEEQPGQAAEAVLAEERPGQVTEAGPAEKAAPAEERPGQTAEAVSAGEHPGQVTEAVLDVRGAGGNRMTETTLPGQASARADEESRQPEVTAEGYPGETIEEDRLPDAPDRQSENAVRHTPVQKVQIEDQGQTPPKYGGREAECSAEQCSGHGRECQSERRRAHEAEERPERQPEPEILSGDKWEQLCRHYPRIFPFGEEREYLSITPRDFIILGRKYQCLVQNSFLLHGYYNYGHVVLTRIAEKEEECFYLGVPGVYYDREKQAALMFGFEGFEAGTDRISDGGFGYYMKRVEI